MKTYSLKPINIVQFFRVGKYFSIFNNKPPSLRPFAWPLALNLSLPVVGTNLYLPAQAPNLYLPAVAQICIYQPGLAT